MRSEENQAGVTSLEPNEEKISRRREQSAVSNDSAGSSERQRRRIDTFRGCMSVTVTFSSPVPTESDGPRNIMRGLIVKEAVDIKDRQL